jgi:dolichol-phosphate mannosyltransferase
MAANADLIAVMDADFQHDERVLRTMFEAFRGAPIDLVVGTRYAAGGGIGDWDETRRKMSDLGTRVSRLLVGNRTSDPLSGFFMIRRTVIADSIHDFSQSGYKILLDILGSAPASIRIAEVPYQFRDRRAGGSKISLMIVAEFAFLLVDKLTKGWISPRFVLFALVGGLGLGVHLAILTALHAAGQPFLAAQSLATLGAMIFNFGLNNEFTYRDRRLSGAAALGGLALFMAICSVGAAANIGVAELAIRQTDSWTLSGVLGALMGAVFNFGVANKLVWSQRKPRAVAAAVADPAAPDDDAASLALSPIGRNR